MEKNIDDVLAKLNKKTRDRIKLASESELIRLPLASTGLTAALGGGIGLGRQTLVYGSKSAGKTALLLQSIGMWQKMGYVCAFIDVEGSFEKSWAARLGVDTTKLLLSQAKATDDIVEDCLEYMEAGVDVILIDSITAMIPVSWFEKSTKKTESHGEMKGMESLNQIGSQAVDMSRALKLINGANKNTSIILISQQRNKINTYGASLAPSGGLAVEFYSTTSIRLFASKADKEQKKGEVMVNGHLTEMPIGREVTWTIEYNKIGPPSQFGTYNFYYAGDEVGVDTIGETVDEAVKLGLIEKGGAWYEIEGGTKFHGMDNLINYYRGNPECFEELKEQVISV